jgi:hypothetical protein
MDTRKGDESRLLLLAAVSQTMGLKRDLGVSVKGNVDPLRPSQPTCDIKSSRPAEVFCFLPNNSTQSNYFTSVSDFRSFALTSATENSTSYSLINTPLLEQAFILGLLYRSARLTMESTYQDGASHGPVTKDSVEMHVSQVSSPVVEDSVGRARLDTAKSWFGYVKTKQFWIVLVFGQVAQSHRLNV